MYNNGDGIRQNKKIAKELFGKACDGGLNKGCKNYKILNEKGI
jgi:TPR repeat protein